MLHGKMHFGWLLVRFGLFLIVFLCDLLFRLIFIVCPWVICLIVRKLFYFVLYFTHEIFIIKKITAWFGSE